jgi:hypothetical protein
MSAPAITTQPVSQRIKLGAALVLSIVATGAASYQWYVRTITGQQAAQAIEGKTSASMSISEFSYNNEGNYSCIATNSDGSTQSEVARVKAAIAQLDEEYLQRRIYEWINSVMPLWNGIGGRTAGSSAMVWHMQDIHRWPTPVLMGRISALHKIGRDAVFQPDNNGSRRQAGEREFMLYLHYFGVNALTLMNKVSDMVQDAESTKDLREDGVTPVWPEDVIDAHQYLDTMPEEGALLDIRFRTTSEWSSTIDVIESVEADGIITLENEIQQAIEISS